MKIFSNIIIIIQSIVNLAGIIFSVIFAQRTMFDVFTLWITNLVITAFSILVFLLPKKSFIGLAILNNIFIILAIIANFIKAHLTNLYYVISFFGLSETIYYIFISICLIVNLAFLIFYIRKYVVSKDKSFTIQNNSKMY